MDTRMKKLCITLAILVLGGLVACGIFWAMIRSNVIAAYTADAEKQEALSHREQELALQSLLTDVSSNIQTLSSRVIDSNGTVPFIDMVESLARAAGTNASIDSANIGPANEGDTFETLSLSISAGGNWRQVYTFLSMIESLPYKISFDNAALSVSTSVGTSGKATTTAKIWKASMNISVLKRK
jgi:Tfp pilus assembly protein PilO